MENGQSIIDSKILLEISALFLAQGPEVFPASQGIVQAIPQQQGLAALLVALGLAGLAYLRRATPVPAEEPIAAPRDPTEDAAVRDTGLPVR